MDSEKTAMKNTDRMLISIVIGAILLVVVAFVLVLNQPEPAYKSDDTPESVAHNYLLALRQGDFERAYGYLWPEIDNYPPTVESFIDDIEDDPWIFRLDDEVSLAVTSSTIGTTRATVSVEESRFSGGGLFESGRNEHSFDIHLRSDNGSWKIFRAGG